ncbi:MAG: hypothetical protein IPM42_17855 [Saprospiraceae bacterium]|nr:hypothetical protein [Saprospiraceae bacterium]
MISLFWTISLNFYFLLFTNIPTFSPAMTSEVFMGMDNIIMIKLNNCNPADITVKANPANVYKRDDSTYAFNPTYLDGELKIKLYYKNVICEIKTVEIKKMPELTPVLDREKDGFIRLADLAIVNQLSLDSPSDFPVNFRMRIFSYNLYLIDKNGLYVYSAGMKDSVLTDQAKEAMKKLKPGSRIQINNMAFINDQNVTTRSTIHKEILVIE